MARLHLGKLGREADDADEGAGRLHRRAGRRSVQVGALPLLKRGAARPTTSPGRATSGVAAAGPDCRDSAASSCPAAPPSRSSWHRRPTGRAAAKRASDAFRVYAMLVVIVGHSEVCSSASRAWTASGVWQLAPQHRRPRRRTAVPAAGGRAPRAAPGARPGAGRRALVRAATSPSCYAAAWPRSTGSLDLAKMVAEPRPRRRPRRVHRARRSDCPADARAPAAPLVPASC